MSVAFGRTYFGCHWLYCSVIGAVQGAATTYILAYAMHWHDRQEDDERLGYRGGTLMLVAIVAYYATAEIQKLAGLK